MKLLFKQRMFSWFCSYDVYDEIGNIVYKVKGELSWGHLLRIYDAAGQEVGYLKEKIFTWFPEFEMYTRGGYAGCIKKEFSLFKPKFYIDLDGWQVKGNLPEWDYTIVDIHLCNVATISKQLLNWTDTYVLDIQNPQDALHVLMLTLAIDAEKCSRKD